MIGAESGTTKRSHLAPLYHPDTLVDPDTHIAKKLALNFFTIFYCSLLVVVGVITGSIVYQITDDNPSVQDTVQDDSSGMTIAFPQFEASLFFYILLPP